MVLAPRGKELVRAVRELLDAVHIESISELSRKASDPLHSALWIDGIDSINSIRHLNVKSYVDFLDNNIKEVSFGGWICEYRKLLERFGGKREEYFYPFLAILVSAIHSKRHYLDIFCDKKVAIINDYVMIALSETYELIRVHSYNAGVLFRIDSGTRRGHFHPGDHCVTYGSDYVCPGTPKTIQHYNLTHDLSHIVFFSDAYRCGVPVRASLSHAFVLMEECCCAIDILIISELLKFNQNLRVLAEFRGVEPSLDVTKIGKVPSVAQQAAHDNEYFQIIQRTLKASATAILRGKSPPATLPKLKDVRGWISFAAQTRHAKESVRLAQSLQKLGSYSTLKHRLIRPETIQRSCSVADLSLSLGSRPYGLRRVEADTSLREQTMTRLNNDC